MLRRFAHTPATISVVRCSETLGPNSVLRALEENRGLRIYAAPRDADDLLSMTLDIYTVEALRAAHITPLSSEKEKLQVPRYSRKVSWPKLLQLRKALHSKFVCQQCDKCQEMMEYLEHCFEHPAMFTRTWNGEMILNTKAVAHFMNTLVGFVGSLQECAPGACEDRHRQFVSCVSSFLVPASTKHE